MTRCFRRENGYTVTVIIELGATGRLHASHRMPLFQQTSSNVCEWVDALLSTPAPEGIGGTGSGPASERRDAIPPTEQEPRAGAEDSGMIRGVAQTIGFSA